MLLFVYLCVLGVREITRPFAELEVFSAAPLATLKLLSWSSNLQPAPPNRETLAEYGLNSDSMCKNLGSRLLAYQRVCIPQMLLFKCYVRCCT